jgi:O-antigen chain-terminating methyltransferase
VAPEANNDVLKTEELAELLREIRERVRARHPEAGDGAGLTPVADLMPLVHARDAAEAKVAAIGSVNPRPSGPLNALIQIFKRTIARALGWFVRDQIVFNREVMACVESTLDALNEMNRALAATAGLPGDFRDMRAHWATWRTEWERNLTSHEAQFLRSIAELQGAFQHRVTLIESNFRELVKSQLDRTNIEIQKRLWADLERIRADYEALIHTELRLIRQRAGTPTRPGIAPLQPAPGPASLTTVEGAMPFDYARFAERFRGEEDYVKSGQRFYVPYFAGRKEVLDIGCGRGEFLDLMREAGVPARGIDLSAESVELCRRKGLQAEVADLFTYLDGLADASLDGIFSAQVVEHLPPNRLPEMIRLAAQKLGRGGVIAIETPNPQCLAIFATHFYLDPTHARPIPDALLSFYMEENGIGHIEMHSRSPAIESMPALASLPDDFRNAFFGGLDYAIIGRKLV